VENQLLLNRAIAYARSGVTGGATIAVTSPVTALVTLPGESNQGFSLSVGGNGLVKPRALLPSYRLAAAQNGLVERDHIRRTGKRV